MRKVVLWFTAPLILGGVAWAIGMADEREKTPSTSGGRAAVSPAGRNTSNIYAPRGGTPGEASATRRADLNSDEPQGSPQRFVRDRSSTPPGTLPSTATAKPVKNVYKDLFENTQNPDYRPDTRTATATAPKGTGTTAKPGSTPLGPNRPASTAREIQQVGHTAGSNAGAGNGASGVTTAAAEEDPFMVEEAGRSGVVPAKFEQTPTSRDSQVQPITYTESTPSTSSPSTSNASTAARPTAAGGNIRRIPTELEEQPAEKSTGKPASPVVPAFSNPLRPEPVRPSAVTNAAAERPALSGGNSNTAKPIRTQDLPRLNAEGPKFAPPSSKTGAATGDVIPAGATHSTGAAAATTTAAGSAPATKTAAAATSPKPASTNNTQPPALQVRWVPDGELNLGQECKCSLVVKNTGAGQAQDVVVEAFFPRHVRLINADPFPSESTTHLVWNFDQMSAGEERSIRVTMVPTKRGELPMQATARCVTSASLVLTVEEPKLVVSVKGPQEVLVGEAATQIVTVQNTGSGIAQDVIVSVVLPEGLEHSKGKKLQLPIGSLNGGEARDIRLPLTALAGGDQVVAVEARANANLSHTASTHIKVNAPKLDIAVTGPSLRYLSRHANYTVTVSNNGSVATNNVRVTQEIPAGFEFVKADRGGKHDASQRTVSWFLGHLDAKQSLSLQLELSAAQLGTFQHKAKVTADSGVVAEAKTETKVDGAVALVMEVADLDDPVEINTQTAYEIRVRNDGSKAAQQVGLVCELPQGVELLDAEGPGKFAVEKGVIVFQPLAEIAPRKSVVYRVKIQGKIAGNMRFRARLSSSSMTDPLIAEEATKFYAD